MSLRIAVAAPFQQQGRERMRESEFVVSLSLDRDWFSPDQAKRLVDVASSQGLLSHDGDQLVAEFDPSAVEIPDEFAPDESLLQEQSTFEKVLDKIVSHGTAKQTAVAEINELQQDAAISVEAAAIVYARKKDIDVSAEATEALADLKA